VTEFDRYSYCNRGNRIVTKGEKIISERIELFINKKQVSQDEISDDGIFVPEGLFKAVDTSERKPLWLTISKKKYKVEIDYNPDDCYSGAFTWNKAGIKCKGKDINVLAVVGRYCDVQIFYSEEPESFYHVSDAVFAQRIFSDDFGSDWDGQLYYFEDNVRNDIANIVKRYPIYDLLKGLTIAGITPENVVTIEVVDHNMVVKANDGSEKTLTLV
jgi:hypothetical protein